jgi:transposase-like protein
MAERRTRCRFTAEFKARAVKRVLDGCSLSEVATELGLSTGQLSTWRTEHLAAGSTEALTQGMSHKPWFLLRLFLICSARRATTPVVSVC